MNTDQEIDQRLSEALKELAEGQLPSEEIPADVLWEIMG